MTSFMDEASIQHIPLPPSIKTLHNWLHDNSTKPEIKNHKILCANNSLYCRKLKSVHPHILCEQTENSKKIKNFHIFYNKWRSSTSLWFIFLYIFINNPLQWCEYYKLFLFWWLSKAQIEYMTLQLNFFVVWIKYDCNEMKKHIEQHVCRTIYRARYFVSLGKEIEWEKEVLLKHF